MPVDSSSPLSLVVVMVVLGMLPFGAMMLTSFLKISIVLFILRSAIGAQQIPSSHIINGLALILSFFVMAPVFDEMYQLMNGYGTVEPLPGRGVPSLLTAVERAKEPLRTFLKKHAAPRDVMFFVEMSAARSSPTEVSSKPEALPHLTATDFRVLMPAFVTSQLSAAFWVGFLVYVPFLVVDLVVANVLIATGMAMMQPAYVSLPVKLCLFVLANGWQLIIRGLLLSYV